MELEEAYKKIDISFEEYGSIERYLGFKHTSINILADLTPKRYQSLSNSGWKLPENEEELKKKSEEERRQAEEKRKAELEKVSYEGLVDLKARRDKVKTDLDNIYTILRNAKNLPREKQIDFRNKAQKIEEEIQKMNLDIETYKDQLYTKEMKAQNEDKAKLEELNKQKEESKIYSRNRL